MKKNTRLAVVCMLMILLITMAIPVQADTVKGSITVNGTSNGAQVELYKIFDLTYEGSHVSYTIDADWSGFFSGAGAGYIQDTKPEGSTLNPIIVDGTTKYVNIVESNKEAFADAALAYALTLEPDASKTAAGSDALVFDELPLGYYLIYPVGASELSKDSTCICSLDSTMPDATVYVKAIYPSITKSEVNAVVSAEVGQKVAYVIKGEVPNTTGYNKYSYIIRDTMTNMSYNKDFVIKVANASIDASLYTLEESNNGFVVSIDVMNLQDLKGNEIRIEYSATITEATVVDGAANSAVLTYSNNPDRMIETVTTPSETQTVYSSQIIIDKQDSETGRKLAGASFVLKNAEGKYYQYDANAKKVSWVDRYADAKEFTTGESGRVAIIGLADGTYFLTETKAPNGYNKLTEDLEITVAGDAESNKGASYTAVVKNHGGVELPSTGGVGTTIFYGVGSVLIGISLVSMFLSKKTLQRKNVK